MAEIDKDDFMSGIADAMHEHVKEYLESEAQEGHFECDCGNDSFDIEVWENADGQIQAAGVCRECNSRLDISVDQSDIEDLR